MVAFDVAGSNLVGLSGGLGLGGIIIRSQALSHRKRDLGLDRVRLIGLEPTRRETPDPKSGASTNSATSAF